MRVVIAGGGIAGVECALTLATGLPDAEVVLIHEWPSLRVLPNLVYVPFGVSAHRLDVPIVDALEPLGVTCITGTVDRIDATAREVFVDGVPMPYDTLVLATGTVPERVDGRTLRSVEDALLLRNDLEALEQKREGFVTVLELPDNSWPAPGYELAALLGTWRAAHDLTHVSIALVTSARTPLGIFGIEAADAALSRLHELEVEVIQGVPAGRVEQLNEGLSIDMVSLHARSIPGGPAVGAEGFYITRHDGSTSDGIFVVGDAADIPFKAAFATSWQARRVLLALGGDLDQLGPEIDGIPVAECEYQMDLGNSTLAIRIPCQPTFAGSWRDLIHSGHTAVIDQPPDKLCGTLIRHHLLETHHEMNPERTFQRLLHE